MIKDLRRLKASVMLSILLLTSNNARAYATNGNGELPFNITTDGNPMYYEELYNSLNDLPEGIKLYLSQENLNVLVLDEVDDAEYFYKKAHGYSFDGIIGFLWPRRNTIYVESANVNYYDKNPDISLDYDKEEFNYMIVRDTLIHELGHFFDYKEGFKLSESDEFKNIYDLESKKYMETTHYKVDNLGVYLNIDSSLEYFATAYACYIKYPEELKEKCPQTYEYIDNYMVNLNKEYSPNREEKMNISVRTRRISR